MQIIPAVDILYGQCAQLVGGKLGTEKFYGDPVDIAMKWADIGAKSIHVIDLDATLSTGGNNLEIANEIKQETGAIIQFGGGIRTVDDAKKILASDIDRIIIGTLMFDRADCLDELESERIIVAIDSKKDEVVIKGWQESTGIKPTELIKKVEDQVWGFLYTNVDVEGRMEGPDLKKIEEVVDATKKPVIVSGGISSFIDISVLDDAGAWGVVIGKALYEGKIKLEDFLG